MSSATKLVAVGFAGAAVLVGLAWLAFGFFGIQSAFTDTEVSEGGPVFASTEESEEFDAAMEAAAANPTEADDAMMPGEIVTLLSGDFTGHTGHDVTGEAAVLNDGTEQRFLRLENFESTNGPDLNVYLRAENGDFRDLGDLKGNIGDQNYEIPADVDLSVYSTVEIWCVRFSVLFGDAPLA